MRDFSQDELVILQLAMVSLVTSEIRKVPQYWGITQIRECTRTTRLCNAGEYGSTDGYANARMAGEILKTINDAFEATLSH